MALPGEATLVDTYRGPYANGDPVVDPTTEVSGDVFSEALADLAGLTRTGQRAWVTFLGVAYSGSGTDSVAVLDHNAVWGGAALVKPTVTQSVVGVYVVTWPVSVVDALGVTRVLNIRYPHPPTTLAPTLCSARVIAKTSNTLTVKTSTGADDSLAGIPIGLSWT